MFFGKVIGTIWATRKDESLSGKKLQFVQPMNSKLENSGEPLIAVDTVGAGVGENIFYITSREATVPLAIPFAPVDAAIVGILDKIDVEK
ncbi:MAG: EutN/CcmL family microcompartment protein [Bacteroidota bacterium]